MAKNQVKLISGNLTREVVRRQAGSKEVLSTGVAIKDAQGETVFMDVTLWIDEKTSPAVVSFMEALEKGTPVAIKGPIKEKSYTKKTGETVNGFDISVWDIFSGPRKGRAEGAAPVAAPAAQAPAQAPAAPISEDVFKSAF